jgi:UDP-galactopyranose mutase
VDCDYLIVGSGLTGAVMARQLKDAGFKVLVVERRHHLGGNVHDHYHVSGIRVHTYGPHYFRTASDKIWEFVNRFSSFYKFEAVLNSIVDGQHENWPVLQNYIDRAIGNNWKPDFTGAPTNFEEASLSMMPRAIYEKFVKGYTEKQWGVPAVTLSAELAGRFTVHTDNDPRLKKQRYQGIPTEGYAVFMQRMLAGIPVVLNCDYLNERSNFNAKHLTVFTGPIDQFFGYSLGRLAYRGQRRASYFVEGVDLVQPVPQVNNPNPNGGDHIRTLEWKHMLPKEECARIRGTLLTTETPFSPTDPDLCEYPFPDETNRQLYKAYRELADRNKSVLICGRLGEYRYLDMDQAIGRALVLVDRILMERQAASSIPLIRAAEIEVSNLNRTRDVPRSEERLDGKLAE